MFLRFKLAFSSHLGQDASKTPPGRFPDASKTSSTPPRRPQDAPKTPPRRVQNAQETSKTPPRRPQDASKTHPRRSRRLQDASKTPSRGLQDASKTAKRPPRCLQAAKLLQDASKYLSTQRAGGGVYNAVPPLGRGNPSRSLLQNPYSDSSA